MLLYSRHPLCACIRGGGLESCLTGTKGTKGIRGTLKGEEGTGTKGRVSSTGERPCFSS